MEEKTAKNTRKQTVEEQVNPLQHKKIAVKFVPRPGGPQGDNPHHVLSGGKMENAPDLFGVPMLSTGEYKNPLTKNEKKFLEEVLDMEENALSVYKTVNNFWWDYFVQVGKEGITLDLSNPEDYIKYKVLLANTDTIAPSPEVLQDRPMQTYKYVLVEEGAEEAIESQKMDATMACYKEFGKIDNDLDTMRVLTELLDARPYSGTSNINFFRSRINQLIQADAKTFLRAITDPLLHTKVIIRRANELGKIVKRNDFYYLANGNIPMCEIGKDSTLSEAARWLNLAINQDTKAMLEAAVDDSKTA